MTICLEIIDDDCVKAIECEDFLRSEPDVIDDILDRGTLRVSEYYLYKKLVRWTVERTDSDESTESKSTLIQSLFRKIRFPLMTPSELNRVRISDICPNGVTETALTFAEYLDKQIGHFNAEPRRGPFGKENCSYLTFESPTPEISLSKFPNIWLTRIEIQMLVWSQFFFLKNTKNKPY